MAHDFTLCPGGECPLRRDCYRFRGIPDARQDWLTPPPFDPVTGECALFHDLAQLRPREADVRDRAYFLWVREGRPAGRSEAHWHAAEAELTAAFEALLRP